MLSDALGIGLGAQYDGGLGSASFCGVDDAYGDSHAKVVGIDTKTAAWQWSAFDPMTAQGSAFSGFGVKGETPVLGCYLGGRLAPARFKKAKDGSGKLRLLNLLNSTVSSLGIPAGTVSLTCSARSDGGVSDVYALRRDRGYYELLGIRLNGTKYFAKRFKVGQDAPLVAAVPPGLGSTSPEAVVIATDGSSRAVYVLRGGKVVKKMILDGLSPKTRIRGVSGGKTAEGRRFVSLDLGNFSFYPLFIEPAASDDPALEDAKR